MGAKLQSGTLLDHAVGDFVVAEKNLSRIEGGLVLADYLQMLVLDKWVSGDINFRYWHSKEAIEFLLNHCGFGADWMDLEDIESILIDSSPEGLVWAYENGQSIAELIQDIAYRGQFKAAVWCDGAKIRTGCPYCRTQRTSEDYLTHMDNGWNSTGCRAADVLRVGGSGIDRVIIASMQESTDSLVIAQGIEAEETWLRSGNYATRLLVEGRDEYDLPVRLHQRNTEAVGPTGSPGDEYVGWSIPQFQREDNLKSFTDLYNRGTQLWKQMLTTHKDCKRISLPLAVTADAYLGTAAKTIWEGMVVQIIGGRGLGTDGKLYRVISVAHNPQDMSTELFCKEMKGYYG